ncbi:MAG: hypothetical protein AAGA29_04960 [Planctomycetota bacterium]
MTTATTTQQPTTLAELVAQVKASTQGHDGAPLTLGAVRAMYEQYTGRPLGMDVIHLRDRGVAGTDGVILRQRNLDRIVFDLALLAAAACGVRFNHQGRLPSLDKTVTTTPRTTYLEILR